MLIALSGLPGTGKTTIAQSLARKIGAVYIRIDSLEQAYMESGKVRTDVGAAGYLAGYAVARDNLQLGLSVVADSANLLHITRNAWRAVAIDTGVRVVEIELICSDKEEHRRRVEGRRAHPENFEMPTWESVLERQCDLWVSGHLVIDTTAVPVTQAVEKIIDNLVLPAH